MKNSGGINEKVMVLCYKYFLDKEIKFSERMLLIEEVAKCYWHLIFINISLSERGAHIERKNSKKILWFKYKISGN